MTSTGGRQTSAFGAWGKSMLRILILLFVNAVAFAEPSLTPTLQLPNPPPYREPAKPAPLQSPAPTPMQWHGAYGGNTAFATSVAEGQQRWESLWRRVNSGPPQALNPATEMGVVVHLGQRPTGGYRVRVLSTYTDDKHYVIEFAEFAPERDSIVTQALTQPWVIALVPYTTLPVIFRKVTPTDTKP